MPFASGAEEASGTGLKASLKRQLLQADVVLLNKGDLVQKQQLDQLKTAVAQLAPHAGMQMQGGSEPPPPPPSPTGALYNEKASARRISY